MINVSVNQKGGILIQCIHITNHHDGHFKYLTILFANKGEIKK